MTSPERTLKEEVVHSQPQLLGKPAVPEPLFHGIILTGLPAQYGMMKTVERRLQGLIYSTTTSTDTSEPATSVHTLEARFNTP